MSGSTTQHPVEPDCEGKVEVIIFTGPEAIGVYVLRFTEVE